MQQRAMGSRGRVSLYKELGSMERAYLSYADWAEIAARVWMMYQQVYDKS